MSPAHLGDDLTIADRFLTIYVVSTNIPSLNVSPTRLWLQLAEISRVLRPGGVLVASTFLKAAAPLGEILGDDIVRPLNQVS